MFVSYNIYNNRTNTLSAKYANIQQDLRFVIRKLPPVVTGGIVFTYTMVCTICYIRPVLRYTCKKNIMFVCGMRCTSRKKVDAFLYHVNYVFLFEKVYFMFSIKCSVYLTPKKVYLLLQCNLYRL